MKLSLVILFFVQVTSLSFSQTRYDDLDIYKKASEKIKEYQEFKDYLTWATSTEINVSGEILYSSEVLNVCSKCSNRSKNEKPGVKKKIIELESFSESETRVVMFFTEIQNNCFSALLKTTFNDEFSYEQGVFVGKQAYFQFTVENAMPTICSRMVLNIH